MLKFDHKAILTTSLLQAVLIIAVSCVGLFTPGQYAHETFNWKAQSVGQDAIDLFLIVPSLVITAVITFKKNIVTFLLWGGVNLYLVYTFAIYCFDIHFGDLFMLYCFVFGSSVFSFLYFLVLVSRLSAASEVYKLAPVIVTAIYFFTIACLFYILWLSDIIPSIGHGTVPKELSDAGSFTDPVHVIDLSILLPGVFITSLLLLRKKALGVFIAPVLLMFFVLMDISRAIMALFMRTRGLCAGYALPAIMAALTVFTVALLFLYMRSIKSVLDEHHSFIH